MKVHFDDLLMQLNRAENDNKCEYCHWPFKPVMMKKRDGYVEAVLSLHDNQGTYFGFYEERPDGQYSKIGLDTFKCCPMCGRRLDKWPHH